MNTVHNKSHEHVLTQNRIAFYFVIAVLLHAALLAFFGTRAFQAVQSKIVASFDAAPLPQPLPVQKASDDPNAVYRDFEYKGPTLGGGGGTPGKGAGGIPTAGGGTPESYPAHILTPSAQPDRENIADVIGIMDETKPTIARPVGGPNGVGLMAMSDLGHVTVGTAGVQGPGGGILGARMGPQRAINLDKYHGSTETERAVIAALRWLKANQSSDGSWAAGSNMQDDTREVVGTALATLAFLGHGETPDSAEFGPTVQRGLQFLITHIDKKGYVFGANMYAQGLAALTLSEGYILTQSPMIREPLERVVGAIVRAQNARKIDPRFKGGWRYKPSSDDSDTLVSGWVIAGLKSAENAGIAIPPSVFDNAGQFLWNMYDTKNPGFSYNGNSRSASMTAVGVLCQQFMGDEKDPRIQTSLNFLREQKADWDKTKGDYVLYGWYYITQAMFQAGGPYWQYWNREIQDTMLKHQLSDGRWMPPPNSTIENRELAATPAYSTALGALILEVYYRYEPVYELSQQSGDSSTLHPAAE
jgi:hypothetical protein